MTLTFNLDLFRWRIGGFTLRLDLDPAPAALQLRVDGIVKTSTRKWFNRLTS